MVCHASFKCIILADTSKIVQESKHLPLQGLGSSHLSTHHNAQNVAIQLKRFHVILTQKGINFPHSTLVHALVGCHIKIYDKHTGNPMHFMWLQGIRNLLDTFYNAVQIIERRNSVLVLFNDDQNSIIYCHNDLLYRN